MPLTDLRQERPHSLDEIQNKQRVTGRAKIDLANMAKKKFGGEPKMGDIRECVLLAKEISMTQQALAEKALELKRATLDQPFRPAMHSIPSAVRYYNMSRSTIYRMFGTGQLRRVKLGRRTLIADDDLRALFL